MTQAAPPPAQRPGYPPSPCNRVCTLNDEQVCLGCYRTLDEIMAWAGMTAAEQYRVLEQLPNRRD